MCDMVLYYLYDVVIWILCPVVGYKLSVYLTSSGKAVLNALSKF